MSSEFKIIGSFFALLFLLNCSGGKEAASSKKASDDGPGSGKAQKLEKGKTGKVKVQNMPLKGRDSSSGKEGTVLLYHERTPCYGKCPIYTLRIQKNGKAELRAERYTVVDQGTYEGKVKREKLRAIKEKAREIDFFQLDKVYDNKGVTDLPSRITKLSFDGKSHKVRNRYQGPEKLEELESLISGIVKNTEWSPAPSKE